MRTLTTTIMLCTGGLAQAAFLPGHLYTPGYPGGKSYSRLVAWTPGMEYVNEIRVDDVEAVTGGVFNRAGNIVVIGRYEDHSHVLEIDGEGQVVKSYQMRRSSLALGSYVDYNPVTGNYIVAEAERITLLDGDFNAIASSDDSFRRASGVLFGADGTIYATDQFRSNVRRFTPDLSEELSPILYGSDVAAGMSLRGDGEILLTQFGRGQIDVLDLDTETITPLITELGYREAADVVDLGNGTFAVTGDRNQMSLFSYEGELLAKTRIIDMFSDSLAFYNPIPSPSFFVPMIGLYGSFRRRRR